jgi:hypothetical protein
MQIGARRNSLKFVQPKRVADGRVGLNKVMSPARTTSKHTGIQSASSGPTNLRLPASGRRAAGLEASIVCSGIDPAPFANSLALFVSVGGSGDRIYASPLFDTGNFRLNEDVDTLLLGTGNGELNLLDQIDWNL